MFWILLILIIFSLLYWKIKESQKYWTYRHVKQFTLKFGPISDLYGIIFGARSFQEMVYEIYNSIGPNERYVGSYSLLKPFFLVKDTDLLVELVIKNFDHFTDHNEMLTDDVEPLWTRNLLNLQKEEWKQMRATLSPAFTSSKMKNMFIFMDQCARQLVDHLRVKEVQEIDLKDTFTRYSNDVIASCAFGLQCNSFTDPNNEFYQMGKKITNFRGFKTGLVLALPKLAHRLGIHFFDRQASDFFTKLITDTIKMREENNIVRLDMLHLLVEAQKGNLKDEESKISDESGFAATEEYSDKKPSRNKKHIIEDIDIFAQALIFFSAGFESVSNFLTFVAYELALHPDIQERLLAEIDDAVRKNGGNSSISHQDLNKMKLLDNIISETLRKYPAIAGTDRVCVKPYTIQPVHEHEKQVHLSVGDIVSIPIYGFHYDPKYFPEPERFDPDRFSDERKSSIKPNTFMTFGIGPRNCIGSRFALLESKAVLFNLFLNFKLAVCEKTQIPLVLEKSGFITTAKDRLFVKLIPRNKY